MKSYGTIILSALTLCACVSYPNVAGQSNLAVASGVEKTARGVALSAIGKAQISAGECGMLLWTLDEDRPQPIFQFISGGKADVMHYGSPEKMTLVGASGPGGFGVHQNQEFHTADGSVMKVSVSFGQGFDGGSYLKQGLITIDSPAGMRSVIPAAGIAGCRG